MNKPLVINTDAGQAEGRTSVWNEMQNMPNFIRDISTPAVNTAGEEVSAIISGIPTPWARAMMFKYAIEYVPDAGAREEPKGLMAFYKSLQDEWKGLIACIVLDSSPLTVERIALTYERKDHLYEVKGALGNMLFDNHALWSDPDELATNPQAPAYIQIIKYNGVVIGATSPHSLLFTAPKYTIQPNRSIAAFYKGGKFTNPVPFLDHESLQKLFVYLQYIRERISVFAETLNARTKKPLSVSLVKNFIVHWEKELREQAHRKGYELNEEGLVGSIDKFLSPFDIIFNAESKIYGYQGRFYTRRENDEAREVTLSELLLPSENTSLIEVRFAPGESPERCSVHLLEVDSDQGKLYYSLPLSSLGVMHFEDTLHLLLGKEKDALYRNSLRATYEPEKRQVKVTLSLEVDNGKNNVTLEAIYVNNRTQDHIIQHKKVIAWPDFISDRWTSYYLYSELPHNTSDTIKVFPLQASYDFKFQIKPRNPDIKGSRDSFVYATDLVNNADGRSEARMAAGYNFDKLGVTNLKYEIFESRYPFKGVEMRLQQAGPYGEKIAGYFIVRDVRLSGKNGFRKIQHTNLLPARVGFDFGSNNMCISFSKNSDLPQLIHFKNRRRFLIGNDVEEQQQRNRPAEPHELFFFQNEDRLGQCKSMVMIHDEKRLTRPEIDIARQVSGGFPIFESNVPVDVPVTHTRYTVMLNNTSSAEIYYNMKWSHVDKENKYKEGLLKTMWLMIHAELFADQEAAPSQLVWAYPSAMSESIRLQYELLWQNVSQVQPLAGQHTRVQVAQVYAGTPEQRALTESEAVCKYALSRLGGMSPSVDTLVIGYDVGGSTTDILMVLKVREANGNYVNKLIKQSSVLVAASALSDTVSRSRKMQETIRLFVEKSPEVGFLYRIDRINSQLAPYFLNVLFDRLQDEYLKNLYKEFYSTNSRELFAIAAYVTGLLSFYSGQLTAKVIGKYPEITTVQQGYYGKGGKIFDWLPSVMQSRGEQFYHDCFMAGLNGVASVRIVSGLSQGTKHHKSEVSFGLSSSQEVDMSHTQDIPEILGEEGYVFNGQTLDELSEIQPKHLEAFDGDFRVPQQFKQLGRFINLYCAFVEQYSLMNTRPIKTKLEELPILFRNYLRTHPEYEVALKRRNEGQTFDFKSPLIVLQAMCMFEQVILPNLTDAGR